MENSQSSVPTSISILIDDIYHFYLFKYLDLDDIFNLKLVSKQFYFIVKDYLLFINELYFSNYLDDKPKDHCWFSTTKLIKFRNKLNSNKLPILNNLSDGLHNLKYLRITDFKSTFVKIEDLNKFVKLQVLIIGAIEMDSSGLLCLPDLKALSIQCAICKEGCKPLFVDAPTLHSLHISNTENHRNDLNVIGDLVRLKNPLSITKYLKLQHNDSNVLIFKNLECLEFNYGDAVSLEDLLKFKNLRKLKINFFDCGDIDELKDLFKSKKNDLEIVLAGVRIKEVTKIDQFASMNELIFQCNNYNELEDDLDFFRKICYNKLINRFMNQPSNLLSKYSNIQCLCVNDKIKDENRLINFIKECHNLFSLDLSGASLSQEFYDLLPSICLISELEIYENTVNLNYEFLMNMIYLAKFSTNQDVLITENLNLNSLKYFKRFEFKTSNGIIVLKKIDKDRYSVRKFKDLVPTDQKYSNFNEIVQLIDNLRI